MSVLLNLKPESSDTREETVHESDRIWLEVNRKSVIHSCSSHPPVIFRCAFSQIVFVSLIGPAGTAAVALKVRRIQT